MKVAERRAPLPILAWGSLPPPVHGSAVVNQRVQQILAEFADVRWITPGSSRAIAEVGQPSLSKMLRGAMSIIRYLIPSMYGYRRHIAYLSVATKGPAIYRDLVAWGIAVVTADRIIVHLHSGDLSQFGRVGRLAAVSRWLQERSELWVLSEVFRNDLPMAPTVHVVANGVSCRAAVHGSRSVRDDSQFGVVFLGNHEMEKGVDTAAELATRMMDAPIQWTFAGAPREVATEVMLSGVAAARVGFHRVKQVDAEVKCQLLSSASCLLMPSRRTEAAPLVVLEALNHGVVPIVSDRGALREMVDGVGYVCRDLDDYESALRELIDDPARLHDLSQRAQARWAERYTDDHFKLRVRDLLCEADERSR